MAFLRLSLEAIADQGWVTDGSWRKGLWGRLSQAAGVWDHGRKRLQVALGTHLHGLGTLGPVTLQPGANGALITRPVPPLHLDLLLRDAACGRGARALGRSTPKASAELVQGQHSGALGWGPHTALRLCSCTSPFRALKQVTRAKPRLTPTGSTPPRGACWDGSSPVPSCPEHGRRPVSGQPPHPSPRRPEFRVGVKFTLGSAPHRAPRHPLSLSRQSGNIPDGF